VADSAQTAAPENLIPSSRDRAEISLHEVNHRVANSLSLVAALVGLQSRSVAGPPVRAALDEIQTRIAAIGGVHRSLYTSSDVRSVEVADYLTRLLRDLEASLKKAGHDSTIRFSGEEAKIPTDKAVSVGMVVTECDQRLQVRLSDRRGWRD